MNAQRLATMAMLLLFPIANLAISPTEIGAEQTAPVAEQHCTVRIDPVQPGQEASAVYGLRCFATFSEAISDATAGRVQLAPTVRPSDLTQSMLQQDAVSVGTAPQAATVMGVDYQDSGYSSNSISWTTSNTSGCYNGANFAATHMPVNWDNKVSSAIGFQGCNTYIHYQNVDFGGTSITCTCSSMGYMNDRTSSERWYP